MITSNYVSDFFKNPPIVCADCVQIADRVKVHSGGLYPKDLIDDLRPNEPLVIKEYRKKIFKSYTKGYFNKILTLLQKIAKAEDFKIDYPTIQTSIPEKETIQAYLTKNFPYFDSLENYAFSIILKSLLEDPNGILLVLPTNFALPENEYYTPFPNFYSSENVLMFDTNVLVVRVSEIGFIQKYIFIDKENILFVTKDSTKVDAKFTQSEYKNTIGEIPAFQLGGEIKQITQSEKGLQFVYDSFVTPCLNNFDEAARLYSDHQANMVLHIYPEKYIYQTSECKTCAGTGKVRTNTSVENYEIHTCKSCDGSGYKTSPFGIHEIKLPENYINTQNIPTPPIGYVEKPIELIEALKKEINEQCRQGLSAIGLEFLFEVPTNQSGTAKEYDRQEINTFVGSVARHLVENVLKPIVWYVAQWRYGVSQITQTIEKLLPIVSVPKKFDTLTSAILGNRLQTAIQNKYDYSTRKALEVQYAQNEFGADSSQVKMLKTLYELETLHDKTEDDKMTILANRGVSEIDYIISANLIQFVNRETAENPNFLDLPYKEKHAKMIDFANEIKNSMPTLIPIM